MSTERKGTEIFVGLFLFIGFCVIAAMVVMFGRASMGGASTYEIIVDFPNASGLVRDSDVLLAGARIGSVSESPATPVLVGNAFQVAVKLQIRSDVKIPKGSTFVVGSSGLLGDRFVDVHLHEKFDAADVIQPGSRIAGTQPGGGLSELTDKGGEVMDQVAKEMEKISEMLTRINEGVLNKQNLKNLEDSFANLKVSTENFKNTTKQLDGLIDKAGGAMDATKGTMTTADKAAADLRLAIADLRKMAESATKTVDSTGALVKKAAQGEGALGTLINDPKLADDLKALVANLRRSGVLFYRDRSVRATPVPRPTPRRIPAR
jgi:ABC-type transporter Mla subunit MlaD